MLELVFSLVSLNQNNIIEKIEVHDLDVDELTNQVKRVSELIKFCKDKLYKTESEVQKILDEMEGGEG